MRHFKVALTLISLGVAACSGDTGPAGPAGPRGNDGTDGTDGTDGPEGPTGPQGPSGPSTGRLGGRVIDELSGEGIAGAHVDITPGAFVVEADDTGAYRIELPPGVFSAKASAADYEEGASEEIAIAGGGDVALDLMLAPSNLLVADAGPMQWQAGFGVEVTLDGTNSSAPAGMTLGYEWTQISGAPVTITGADTATPRFTTLPMDESSLPERLTVLGFTGQQVAETSYVFELTVRSGPFAKSARVTVQSMARHGGLENVPVDALSYVSAPTQPSYAWTCTKLDDSSACATTVFGSEASRTPWFHPVVEGLYQITEATAGSLTINAASYIGARLVENNTQARCQSCHNADLVLPNRTITNKFAPWSQTKHATYFQRQIDGMMSPYYNASCIQCHTVGFNPDAASSGFDDLADQTGWTFPATLAPGNYDAMPDELKSRASIGCESCHGPGSQHASFVQTVSVGRSFNALDCNQCHANEPYQVQGLQWQASAHSRFVTGLVTPGTDDPATRGTCASCHSTQGFASWTKTGLQTAPPPTGDDAEPQSCTACHDPHGEARQANGSATPHQLRMFGSVTTLAGFGAENVGAGALCMQCHNSRRTFSTTSQSAPHEPTQADILLGKNLQTFDLGSYPVSPHASVPQACVGCHMAATPAEGEAGHNQIGGHTFNVRSGNLENLSACVSCHDGLGTLNRTAYGDYDGDGVVSGIQDEVEGLEQLVSNAISTAAGALWPAETGGAATLLGFHGRIRLLRAYTPGVSDPACDPAAGGEYPEPCFAFAAGQIPTALTAEGDFVRACWNLLMIEQDHSRGVHNPAFAVAALQRTYRALTGGDVPNATIRR